MPGTGNPPQAVRRRRNADTYADVNAYLDRDKRVKRGPTLGGSWCADTHRWYETWQYSPQAEVFLDTDWQRLQMLVPLVEDYFDRPHHLKLAEIRQSESLLGATHVDRLKARMKVSETKPTVTAPGVTALDEYRAALTG